MIERLRVRFIRIEPLYVHEGRKTLLLGSYQAGILAASDHGFMLVEFLVVSLSCSKE